MVFTNRYDPDEQKLFGKLINSRSIKRTLRPKIWKPFLTPIMQTPGYQGGVSFLVGRRTT